MAGAQFYGVKVAEVAPGMAPGAASGAAVDFSAVAVLAQALSGAAGVCIRVAPEGQAARVMFYPERAGVADLPPALLRGARSDAALQTELDAAGLGGVQFWAAFPLRSADGAFVGLLGVMDDVPRVLTAAAIGQLQVLADVLAGQIALAQASVTVLARRVLRLIEDVTEVDDAAASPVLRGLLRYATGETPKNTEAMALRIAGLAEAKAGKLVLTAMAEGILAQQGFDRATTVPDLAVVAAAAALPEPAVAASDFSRMARLRIGEAGYDVARSEAIDALGFRPGGTDAAWQVLENGLEEGWPEIIAEVLRKTRDVVAEYVRMHMIHVRDAGLPEGQYRYDLYGMGWTVRGTPERAEVSLDGVEWLGFDAADVAMDQPRDLSARALQAACPDLADRIGGDVHEWCLRIAAGSEVAPVFG